MFYTDPLATNIKVTATQHIYVDAEETGDIDGSGRKALVAMYGSRNTCSGAFLACSHKVRCSNSKRMDKMEALSDCLCYDSIFRRDGRTQNSVL